jgi:hypothetical protein
VAPTNTCAKLRRSEGRYYPSAVEQEITRFLEGCEIEFFPTATADEADHGSL